MLTTATLFCFLITNLSKYNFALAQGTTTFKQADV